MTTFLRSADSPWLFWRCPANKRPPQTLIKFRSTSTTDRFLICKTYTFSLQFLPLFTFVPNTVNFPQFINRNPFQTLFEIYFPEAHKRLPTRLRSKTCKSGLPLCRRR